MMSGPANFVGRFIRFLVWASSVTRPGQRRRGSTSAVQITGPGMALDVKRGLVFVPTGSAAYDFNGANRAGDNLFANCLIALKADTGERVWHFQAVRHDIWDRDFPSPPTLVTVNRGGRRGGCCGSDH